MAQPEAQAPPFDWQSAWRQKVTTAAAAARRVRSGDHVFVGSGAGVPGALVEALCARSGELADVEVLHIATFGPAPYVAPELAASFRHAAMFIGANVRGAVQRGEADYLPVHLSDVPRLFRSRQKQVDVALVSVSPPQADGTCSLGAAVDIIPAAVEAADLVVGQVNPRQPRTQGDGVLAVEAIDALVPAARELPEVAGAAGDAVALRIGARIARLVEDGSTLQAGIGKLPDAALAALAEKRDLGVHTEMISDGIADLIRRGAVTNARKALDKGRTVTSFALGSRRLYDFIDRNDDLLFRSTDYTNDVAVIARQPRMVAINGAIEVDLTGQVCADSIGNSFHSGFGGQVDFIRGAARSKGGLPIIALPSTAAGGSASRIVAQLSPGAGVVTTRADVHFVVTEHGVADLHGKSARERAMSLIQIADPRFRAGLMKAAKAASLVYPDQADPPPAGPLYPEQWEGWASARDGTRLFLRPVRATDEDLVREFFYALSEETVYQRFAGVRKAMPHAERQRVVNVDYESEMAVAAVVLEEGHERIVGLATYSVDGARNDAQTAFMVADAYQGRGIGGLLFRKLADIARTKGLRSLTAYMLAGNLAMYRVLAGSGLAIVEDRLTGRVSAMLR